MVNKVFLLGRMGKDPVIKHFDSGVAIAEFTVATDDSYKNKQGEKVEVTDWHNIKIAFPKLVEIAEKYLKKGSLVHIEGKIKARSYDDKDGNKRYITEVICESFKMLDKREDSDRTGNAEKQPAWDGESGITKGTFTFHGKKEEPFNANNPDDDLPF